MKTTGVRRSGRKRSLSAIVVAISLIMAALLWLMFVDSFHVDEMALGLIGAAVTALFAADLWRSQAACPVFRARDLLQGLLVPWCIAKDLGVITAVLFKDAFGIAPAKSLYRVCAFDASRTDAVKIGRQVLEIVYTTASPNAIVLGIDPGSRRMIFHQIERGELTQMMKNLGAKA